MRERSRHRVASCADSCSAAAHNDSDLCFWLRLRRPSIPRGATLLSAAHIRRIEMLEPKRHIERPHPRQRQCKTEAGGERDGGKLQGRGVRGRSKWQRTRGSEWSRDFEGANQSSWARERRARAANGSSCMRRRWQTGRWWWERTRCPRRQIAGVKGSDLAPVSSPNGVLMSSPTGLNSIVLLVTVDTST
ncbi:hypothetical protein DFP72DRAFT_910653 [Ephemerocybe angulata]|uniref:Uncharacterized protein n=1 Tax=Ephemerocybe angulata TaxID=980116 RepID=A0A8H6HPG5_9AGAR|nr:hypothetical protein DFP72DRAFT_910653 [Tulosesus angulatus]